MTFVSWIGEIKKELAVARELLGRVQGQRPMKAINPVVCVLELEAELVRLRDARQRAETKGNALAVAAVDHEQRQLDEHRQRLMHAMTVEEDLRLALGRAK